MRPYLQITAAALLIIAGPAHAFIPASPPPEIGWNGPGLLCEEHFTLQLLPGEYVREDPRYEPWYPLSDTLKTNQGWYSVSVPTFAPRRTSAGLRLIARTPQANLYEDEPKPHEMRRLVRLPRARKEPVVEISFWRASNANGDWRREPTTDPDKSAQADFLKRIRFAKTCSPDCVNRASAYQACGADPR